MAYYDLSKEERAEVNVKIYGQLLSDLRSGTNENFKSTFGDEDTYIRKAGYLQLGKIYLHQVDLRPVILTYLDSLIDVENQLIRQTAINAAGEIGRKEFDSIERLMERGLFDEHHQVRNAVIGSIKKMGQVNPGPVLNFAKRFLNHKDKEIRRVICHGIELRGRTHPEEVLPLLQQLEDDETQRVRSTLVHVIGQIAYKKGCLPKVLAHLKGWKNEEVVRDALDEIIDVHRRYSSFAFLTEKEAIKTISKEF